MNKADLIEAILKQTGGTRVAAENALNATLKAISNSLRKGEPVTLVGFGTFKVVKRAARKGVNPQTKAAMKIPAAKVPKFTPGAVLKEAVKTGKNSK